MALRINLNTAALNAHRQLQGTDSALGTSIERLSSGFRINRAADDPAGLAISENLRAQVAGLGQAISNSSDAVNMIRTAEGSLSEIHTILRTMRNLALHASNTGTNDTTAIAADQTQINSALSALNRIASNTQFGNKKLLDGTFGVTGSSATPANADFISGTATTVAGTYTVTVNVQATKASSGASDDISGGAAFAAATGTLKINNVSVSVTAADDNTTLAAKINAVKDTTGVAATAGGGGILTLDQVSYGSAAKIDLTGSTAAVTGVLNFAGGAGPFAGIDADVDIDQTGGASFAGLVGTGQIVTGTTGAIEGLTVEAAGAAASTAVLTVTNNASKFQIGANAGQTSSVAINSVAAINLGVAATGLNNSSWVSIADISVANYNGAQDAIKLVDAAISQISTMRSELGAAQKDLEANISSLGVAKENIAASESSIRDTDMAAEMVTFTRNQILLQAGTAMLTQANQAPQALLGLLK